LSLVGLWPLAGAGRAVSATAGRRRHPSVGLGLGAAMLGLGAAMLGLGAAMLGLVCAALVLGPLTAAPAMAKEAAPLAEKPEIEARMRKLAEELRCLVCQNQTIADSNAELAQDLRRELRGLVEQGKSDDEIRAFMTARYGDFVLYNPPLKESTALLWVGPFLLLALGGGIWWTVARKRAKEAGQGSAALPPGAVADDDI
jgi:cytochrome c-type biogenesis protein CcmH